ADVGHLDNEAPRLLLHGFGEMPRQPGPAHDVEVAADDDDDRPPDVRPDLETRAPRTRHAAGGRVRWRAVTGNGALPVMPPAAHGVPDGAEQGKDEADHDRQDAKHPDDRDLEQETDDEQDDAEDDHGNSR